MLLSHRSTVNADVIARVSPCKQK